MMEQKEFYSTIEVAQILGISRVQVHRLVKAGKIPAKKVGRNFIICAKDLLSVSERISEEEKEDIEEAVEKVFQEYGDVIRKLGEK